MAEEHPHPLLAQVPLTVSPFLSLPVATPLPYTYKSLPSTLPPSVIDVPQTMSSENGTGAAGAGAEEPKPQYVVSQNTGLAFHPDDIVESCRRLQESLQRMQQDSERAIRKWDGDIRERELAERRRVAPGWLDVGEAGRGLVPERMGGPAAAMVQAEPARAAAASQHDTQVGNETVDQGAELDRAFGSLSMR